MQKSYTCIIVGETSVLKSKGSLPKKTGYFMTTCQRVGSSVATKIESGPKILRFLKIEGRRIRRIFVNSKILRRSSKIANSSNIFEDTKIFKGK